MGRLSQPFELATLAALRAAILATTPSVYYMANGSSAVTLTDSSGNGHDLTGVGAPDPQDSALVPADPTGLYLRLPTGANKYRVANPLAVPFNADWTFFGVTTILDLSEAVNLFSVGGTGETEAANYQVAVGALATGELNVFWESGAGVDNTIASGILLREGIPYGLALRKNGTANTIEFFINAIKVATVAYVNEPTGGTATTLAVGDAEAATTASFLAGHFAFWLGTALTNAQIVNITRAAGLFGPP